VAWHVKRWLPLGATTSPGPTPVRGGWVPLGSVRVGPVSVRGCGWDRGVGAVAGIGWVAPSYVIYSYNIRHAVRVAQRKVSIPATRHGRRRIQPRAYTVYSGCVALMSQLPGEPSSTVRMELLLILRMARTGSGRCLPSTEDAFHPRKIQTMSHHLMRCSSDLCYGHEVCCAVQKVRQRVGRLLYCQERSSNRTR
jgi:hypothetical protein